MRRTTSTPTRRLATALLLATLPGACSGGNGLPVPAAAPQGGEPHHDSAAVGGGAGALAAELLLAGGAVGVLGDGVLGDGLLGKGVADAALAGALDATALAHLRSEALGPGTGPPLAPSALVQRLAAMPGAPADRGGEPGNLDETFAEETARAVGAAGAVLPPGFAPPLLPWAQRSAELTAARPPAPSVGWQTQELGIRSVRLEHVGGFLRARAVAALRLLQRGRRGLLGQTADEGMLGLVLVQQLQGAEETLFAGLFTAGGPLGGLAAPRGYEPRNGARWLPAQLDYQSGVRASDAASDLQGLAAVLEAAATFAQLGRKDAPAPLQALFLGSPFKLPPPRDPPPQPVASWQGEIGPLLLFRCGGCHSGVGEGGFVIDSYQQMLAGGNRTRARNLPMVVPGAHAQSFLHEVLAGPRAPFNQMPLGSPLPPAEVAQIDAWIDAGAPELPVEPPAPPQPGEDLARVSFVNLLALHLDASGALQHRREADAASGFATAAATGAALTALATLDAALPELDYEGTTPRAALLQAGRFAALHLLAADGRARDAVELASLQPGGPAGLRGQAALAAGLLAAAGRLPELLPAAKAACTALLACRDAPSGLFADAPGAPVRRFDDATLAALLSALRRAAGLGLPGAAEARQQLLARLLPVLALAPPDGAGDRLPLLAAAIVVDDAPPPPQVPTWSQHVRPLLLQKCGDCHFAGNARGDYRLDTLRMLATPGESQGALPLLLPGAAEASFLWQKLTLRRPPLGAAMPLQKPPLDAAALQLIRQWIDAGATAR